MTNRDMEVNSDQVARLPSALWDKATQLRGQVNHFDEIGPISAIPELRPDPLGEAIRAVVCCR